MIKTLKWTYILGYENARKDVFKLLEQERGFHTSQAHIKSLEKRTNDKYDDFGNRIVTADDHEQRRIQTDAILTRLDPRKYPNYDNFMDMLK